VSNFHDQSILIAHNPAVTAKFFNIYMKTFIRCLLQIEGKGMDLNEGVLGFVNVYYGYVEAQGQGTLHCHMMVWLEGSLNPNEIKECILRNDK
jgi:hypothetical protein